jgi:lambda family phage tail tape measure protein
MAQDLKIDIVATDKTGAAFRSVQTGMSGIQASASSLLTKISAVTGALAAIGVGSALKGIIEAGDRLEELSKRTSIAVETLSALTNNAKLAGISQEELGSGIVKLSRSIAEAVSDAGEQRMAFQNLGVAIRDVNGNIRPTVEILADVAAGFQDAEDGAIKTQYAVALFGKSGANFIEFLNQGREGVQALGASISTEFADQSATFTDNLDKIGQRIQATISEKAAPFLAFMNRQIEEAIRLDKMTRVGAGRGVVNPEFVVPERTKVKPLTPLSKEKAKEEKDNAKEIASAYEQIADEIFKLVNGERELAIFQFARKGATVEEIAAYTERLDKLAQLKDAQKATEEEAKQYADQDKLNRQARNDLLDKAKQLYDETRTPLEKLNIAEAELLRLLELGVIDFDVYSRAVIQANEALDKMAEDGKNNFADLEAAIRGWGNEFTNIMANAVMTGKLSFKDLANSVISDLLRMSIQAQITKPLMNLGMDFLGIKVSGARAMGGPVTSNQPYLVGENGPEIFMPNNSGTIIPNGQGGSVVVQQTINVTTGVQQTVRAEVMNMLPQIANAAKSAVAEAKLRGGSFAAAMR